MDGAGEVLLSVGEAGYVIACGSTPALQQALRAPSAARRVQTLLEALLEEEADREREEAAEVAEGRPLPWSPWRRDRSVVPMPRDRPTRQGRQVFTLRGSIASAINRQVVSEVVQRTALPIPFTGEGRRMRSRSRSDPRAEPHDDENATDDGIVTGDENATDESSCETIETVYSRSGRDWYRQSRLDGTPNGPRGTYGCSHICRMEQRRRRLDSR